MPRPPALPLAAFAVLLGAAGPAEAQLFVPQPGFGTPIAGGAPVQVVTTRDDSWAEGLFEKAPDGRLARDFGVVARGADTRTRVRVRNNLDTTVRVASVTTSCGCSAGAWEGEKTLAPGDAAVLEISMDTKRFIKAKDSNVIIRFDLPQTAEVRIPVKMYVRTDVVLTPGGVDFGAVDKGAGASRTVEIAYAGYAGWAVKEVRGADGVLASDLAETGRTAGSANYRLTVTLADDAPVGPVRARLLLVTTDTKNPYVPVLVEGRVEDDITVRDVELGTLAGGQTRQFNVVLRGKKPFKIAALEADGPGDPFKMKLPDADTERTVHVLPMIFEAPRTEGVYSETFTVTVDGRDDPVTFSARGRIVGG